MRAQELHVLHVPGFGHARRVIIPHTLEALQGLVEGNIQLLPMPHYGAMYINEEGKYVEGMIRNADASNLLTAAGVQLLPGDYIVGPAVLFGGFDDDGDEVHYGDSMVELCRSVGLEVL